MAKFGVFLFGAVFGGFVAAGIGFSAYLVQYYSVERNPKINGERLTDRTLRASRHQAQIDSVIAFVYYLNHPLAEVQMQACDGLRRCGVLAKSAIGVLLDVASDTNRPHEVRDLAQLAIDVIRDDGRE